MQWVHKGRRKPNQARRDPCHIGKCRAAAARGGGPGPYQRHAPKKPCDHTGGSGQDNLAGQTLDAFPGGMDDGSDRSAGSEKWIAPEDD